MKTFNNFIKEHKVTLSSSDKEKFKNKKAYDLDNSKVARKNAWGKKSLSSDLSSEIKKQFLPISNKEFEAERKTRERTNILRRQGDRRKRGILGNEIDRREGDRRVAHTYGKNERRIKDYKIFSKYWQKNDRRKSERRDKTKSNENRKIAERRAGKNREIKSNDRRRGTKDRRDESNFFKSLFADSEVKKFEQASFGDRRKRKKLVSNERRNKNNSKKTDIDILAPILGKANVTGNVNKKMIEKEFYRIHDKLVEAKKKGKLTRGDVEQYEKLRELVYK